LASEKRIYINWPRYTSGFRVKTLAPVGTLVWWSERGGEELSDHKQEIASLLEDDRSESKLVSTWAAMESVVFFYRGAEPIARIIVVGSLAYLSLILLLRLSGKRTLTQMTAFDFIITIAIGSTFGRLITAEGVSLVESITAFAVLIGLQRLISWLTVRSSAVEKLVTADPTLLYFRGQFLQKAMREQRVTESELLGIVRQNKIGSLREVEAIVMENSGTIAVIKQETSGATDLSALQPVPKIQL
jgi:uncharacterized membrane protein YcaP (DUF421 family)